MRVYGQLLNCSVMGMAADINFRKPLFGDLLPMVILTAEDRVSIPARSALGTGWRSTLRL
jgi:uncharacterized membrane protein